MELNRLPDTQSLANRPSTMKFLAAKTIKSIRTVASDLKMGCVVVGVVWMEMEMDSHGGLEVTIRQTEWKKKLPNNFVSRTSECS